jgi:phosphoribosylaminoimidazolecarboxamide formyltransferase / IMP cyclohydrolase
MFSNCIKHVRKLSKYCNFNIRSYSLKYGLNPSNISAGYYFKGPKTFDVLNGDLSYINVLDAMLGWNLVNEAKRTLKRDVCASYKHNAPAGVSCLGYSNHNIVKHARRCDELSSFGDFISVTGKVDHETATYLKTQVSDGIIADDFTDEAMDILKKKKSGNYVILKGYSNSNSNSKSILNKQYEYEVECKDHFGVTLWQTKDTSFILNFENNNISKNKEIDALLGWITLKYTPSNSVNFVHNKQVIGIGAGQQNRVACIRIAGEKCRNWNEKYRPWSRDRMTTPTYAHVQYVPNTHIPMVEIYKYSNPILYTMCSDGFLPFKDNIDAAKEYDVDLIVQPGGSIKDDDIKEEALKQNIEMIYTGMRAFYH